MILKKIDFIITWVDGNDPVWRAEKAKYEVQIKGDSRDSRYRDWDTLRYWFRSIETNAPWVNKVYFVTCGHVPAWLNTECSKLVLVKHSDYIPDKYLPTFSSRAIDMNFHRIPELSEQFVYFNDDMFLIAPTVPNDFFKNGVPCDMGVLNAITISAKGRSGEPLKKDEIYTPAVFNMALINRHFDKKTSIKNNLSKWVNIRYGSAMIKTLLLLPWDQFTGFINPHLPYPYLKATYSEVWEKEADILGLASEHKFRTSTDVNHFVFSYWQLAKGQFYPRSNKFGLSCHLDGDKENFHMIIDAINKGKYKAICINDEYVGDCFENIKQKLIDSLQMKFPQKSSFEL